MTYQGDVIHAETSPRRAEQSVKGRTIETEAPSIERHTVSLPKYSQGARLTWIGYSKRTLECVGERTRNGIRVSRLYRRRMKPSLVLSSSFCKSYDELPVEGETRHTDFPSESEDTESTSMYIHCTSTQFSLQTARFGGQSLLVTSMDDSKGPPFDKYWHRLIA